MNLIDLANKRCSVRNYSDRPIEDEKMDYILNVARLAPSAVNLQPWSFFVVQTKSMREKLQECYNREWFKTAPAYIVICGNHAISWKRKFDEKDHCDIDVAITAEHLILAATEQGLGTCWVCNFDAASCKKILQLDNDTEPVVIIPVGYAAEQTNSESVQKNRKELDELVFFK